MEPKNFENLENEFNIEKVEIIEPKSIQKIDTSENRHLDTDYEEIRTNLKDIIKRGAEAIDGILKAHKF